MKSCLQTAVGPRAEMLPIVYRPWWRWRVRSSATSIAGRGVCSSRTRGATRIATLLRNRPNPQVDVIVVTDGERILGTATRGWADWASDRQIVALPP